MLINGSSLIGLPILSLHMGCKIAYVSNYIIDPENLEIIAFELMGPAIEDPETGSILLTRDIRELSLDGIIIDSADIFVNKGDVIKLDDVMELEFDIVGLKVVTKKRVKIGKVTDFTLEPKSLMIYQLIVDRPFFRSLVDPQLTINRSQIIELDDYKVTIKHDKANIKLDEADEDFIPNFVNPFRKQDYIPSEEEIISDNSSETSE